jgi:hypothetical protein
MGMPVTIEVIDPSATSRTLSEAMIEFRDLTTFSVRSSRTAR